MKKQLTAASGDPCPHSGIWKVVGIITTNRPIAKDQIIPQYCGKNVTWYLLCQSPAEKEHS